MAPGPFPERKFVADDTIVRTTSMTFTTAAIGFLFAASQASLAKRNVGLAASFTTFGRTFGMFAAGGAAYQFIKSSSKNLRRTDDGWNAAYGGIAGGVVASLFRSRSLPVVLGVGAALGVVASVHDVTGGLPGFRDEDGVDQYEVLEKMRKTYRRPVEHFIAEVGERRGNEGPDYEERRRAHFKQRYGLEIPVYPPATESYAAESR